VHRVAFEGNIDTHVNVTPSLGVTLTPYGTFFECNFLRICTKIHYFADAIMQRCDDFIRL